MELESLTTLRLYRNFGISGEHLQELFNSCGLHGVSSSVQAMVAPPTEPLNIALCCRVLPLARFANQQKKSGNFFV